MEHKEIRLGGSGGQGIILMGIILAEAAIMNGENAIQSQSYGPEARGGASKAEVIISKNDIDFPKIRKPDIFLSLTQEAFDKYIVDVKEEGIIIVDNAIKVPKLKGIKVYKAPIISSAVETLQKPMVSNIIALGVLNKITNLINNDILIKAIISRVPKGTEELNKEAFNVGKNLVN